MRAFKIIFSLFLLLSVNVCVAQPLLKFNNEKKFKIVQFTDVHVKFKNPASDIAIQRIGEVLDNEKPDLVVLTGDIIYSSPADSSMWAALAPIVERDIPFAVTFGNHDDEQGMSKENLFELLRGVKGNMTGDTTRLSGVGNYILHIKSADEKNNAVSIYCLDSHSYSKIKGVAGYDYIKQDQINWYLENSARLAAENNSVPLPSVSFFHIPLPEFGESSADQSMQMVGIRREKCCSPMLNSGMFAAMKQAGDMMGVFVGHDHDNDYAVYNNGILLCYGRYTGGNTVYNNLSNGARVIELTQGERAFKTWIRTSKGVEQLSLYPTDFIKKK